MAGKPGKTAVTSVAVMTSEAELLAAHVHVRTASAGHPMDNPGESVAAAEAATAGGKDLGSMVTLWRTQAFNIFAAAPAAGVRDVSAVRALWRRDADVVVVGSGAAGISAALTAAASGLRVLVVTKDLVGGATPLAQGGLAAALGAGDTPAAHVSDTLVAGAGLSEPEVVAALADAAPGAIGWLTGLGAELETRELRLEGGHSARRIVHSGDDATGAEVHRTLLAALVASGIEILDRTVALDLLLSDTGESGTRTPTIEAGGTNGAGITTGVCGIDGTAAANADPVGALAREVVPARSVTGLAAASIGADGRLTPGVISARAVVIAAGGLGQAFGTTSNPAGATGDGIAIAARAGAVIRDLEFVQFHPTVLWLPGATGQCPLITEALRGAGAVLRDFGGTPLMAGHDPRGDLAPRDVVAARMAEVIAAGDAGHVWLDATGLGRDLLEIGFPTVTAACRKHGIDPVTDLIPVAPGAHYSCGGIRADLDGRTSLPGLYAAGEAASTGVQGANRLASNSVTEAIIAGRRTGTAIADALWRANFATAIAKALSRVGEVTVSAAYRPREGERNDAGWQSPSPPGWPLAQPGKHWAATHSPANEPPAPRKRGDVAESRNRGDVAESRNRGKAADRRGLAQAMSRYAGVMRDADGLAELLRVIGEAGDIPGSNAPMAATQAGESVNEQAGLELDALEALNLRTVSLLIAAGALRRAESRGCHRRRDAAETAATPWHTLARWGGQKLVVTEEEL
jgi:L-aspartate oxidase